MRGNLKNFRKNHNLTQEEIAEITHICRRTYGLIENGKRGGSQRFWRNLKLAFKVPDSKMYSLMKLDGQEQSNEE